MSIPASSKRAQHVVTHAVAGYLANKTRFEAKFGGALRNIGGRSTNRFGK
jgi:hypothetical protein